MIPILYEYDEIDFTSNGLCRLRDITMCEVTEERNGIYECDFEYPVTGANFDKIIPGRIIAVEHDESGDIQPFDIVSYSKPIAGVVEFHAVHISYRLTKMTVAGKNINSLSDAFSMLAGAEPSQPFIFRTNKSSTGYLACADGVPRSCRQVLGGVEGSILDAYGGEYEFDRFVVNLWASRGSFRSFAIRYGLNMTDYTDETDYLETYTQIVPYWTGTDDSGKDIVVKGNRVDSGFVSYSGRPECVPMDFTDKYENKPTAAQLEATAASYMQSNQTNLPQQTISVDFVRLTDSSEYSQFARLQECKLCDTITVEFPRYKMQGKFKIVKTVYDVLRERYSSLELGNLQTTLSDALGISNESSQFGGSPYFAGLIEMYAGSSAPSGWLICDGSAVSRTTYAALFSVIGTDYGSGDGTTTFNIPDLRGKVPIGVSGTHALASSGGAETHKLTANQSGVPAHNHAMNHDHYVSNSGTPAYFLTVPQTGSALSRVTTASGSGAQNMVRSPDAISRRAATDSYTGNTSDNTGAAASQAHNNMQPYLTINYIIYTGV